ncbi:MAG: PPC domain-containing protein [Candidatus Eisenbacteria bacterium]|uniref:PPC domain-containing protein n=1 Tax=Eiseniibacteriota bacterium TaxID=2212470 RepID=A0A956M350_UNCEI|nr:PPC domain-containing protein [Candidatus Eisenbacteria bacterium]
MSRQYDLPSRLVIVTTLVLTSLAGPSGAAPGVSEPKAWQPDLGSPGWIPMQASYAGGCVGALPVVFDSVTDPATISAAAYQAWYTFEATAGDVLTFGTAPVRPEEDTDTFLTLIADDCGTIVAENDDDGPGRHALIYRVAAPYTGRYYVRVRGFSSTDRGRYRAYFMRTKSRTVLFNDVCEGAVALPRCEEQRITGDLAKAENQYDLALPGPSPTGFPSDGRDAAYQLDVRRGDRLILDCTMPKDDTSVYLVSDCGNVTGSCQAWSDTGLNGDKEVIDWTAPASGRYFLIVDSYGKNAGGAFAMNLRIECAVRTGGCCTSGQTCVLLTEQECVSMGSSYLGDDASCGVGTCAPLPTLSTSWGALKHQYR